MSNVWIIKYILLIILSWLQKLQRLLKCKMFSQLYHESHYPGNNLPLLLWLGNCKGVARNQALNRSRNNIHTEGFSAGASGRGKRGEKSSKKKRRFYWTPKTKQPINIVVRGAHYKNFLESDWILKYGATTLCHLKYGFGVSKRCVSIHRTVLWGQAEHVKDQTWLVRLVLCHTLCITGTCFRISMII